MRWCVLILVGILACGGTEEEPDGGIGDGAIDGLAMDASSETGDASMNQPDAEAPQDAQSDMAVDSRFDMAHEDTGTGVCESSPISRMEDFAAKLPVTHRLSLSGASQQVELGISEPFSGIGASLRVGPVGGRLSDNLIESRSGAGAAHQFTLFANLDGRTLVMNQAAGNSAPFQWGVPACLRREGSSWMGANWLPMFTDEIRPGGPTSPLSSGSARSEQVLEGRPEWSLERAGDTVRLEKTWTVRNPSDAPLMFTQWIDWDAFYVRSGFAEEHEMRVRYTFQDSAGRETYDTIIPYLPFGRTPEGTLLNNRIRNAPAPAYRYEYNPGFDGWWVIHTQEAAGNRLMHLIYTFEFEGAQIGVVVEPQMPGRSTFGYETTVYPETRNEDRGSLTLFLVFEESAAVTLAPGEERRYSIRYHIGTLTELAAAGFSVGPIDNGDCSGCLGGFASCEEACRTVAGTPGTCGWPGSTNPGECCACL